MGYSNCNPCDPCGTNQNAAKAAAYARQANTYATNAENSWLEFNALYLGAFAVAPAVDNEGDPLQVGALYWNTVSNTIFVWNGTAWVENGNFNEFTNFSLPSATPVPAANLRTGQEYEIVVVGNTNWTAIGAPAAQVGVRFTKNAVAATGTGTARVTRDLVTRFKDVVNVKDFGAVGSGAVDDHAAIQAAIDASYGKTLFFPDGTYLINSELVINGGCNLQGSGTHTYIATSGNAIRITPAGGLTMQGFVIFKNGNSTTLTIGLLAEGGCKLENISLLNFPIGLELRGISNSTFTNISINTAFGQTTTVAESCCLKISNDSDPQSEFTHQFVNCFFSAAFKHEFAILLNHGDVSYFSNCYIASAKIANVFIQNKNTTVNAAKSFDNCYIDGVSYPTPSTPATLYGIWIKNDGQPSPGIPLVNFRNCHIGQNYIGALIDEPSTYQISFNNCEIFNCWESGIQSTSSEIDLRINGCSFNNIGTVTANGEAILIIGGESINITSNIFRVGSSLPLATFYGIRLENTIEQVCIDGNCFLGIPNDYISTATVGQLLIADNISNNPVNTIVGSIIGNQANSNPLSLDWYQEGTWTPELEFGGATTGIEYNQRGGSYTRIGNRVYFEATFVLTSKGSATGNVSISGIPFPQNVGFPANYCVTCGGLDASIGDANLDSNINNADNNEIVITRQSGGTRVLLNNADFTNITFVNISGTYRV